VNGEGEGEAVMVTNLIFCLLVVAAVLASWTVFCALLCTAIAFAAKRLSTESVRREKGER
jgi:hypothetical protein